MSLDHAIERLRNALQMHNEHRTTMQSLASSVGDFLRDAATLRQQAGRVDEDVRDRVAKAIADVIGHGMREKCYPHADAALEAALSAQPAAPVDVPEESLRRLAAHWNGYASTPASGGLGEARRSEAEKCAIELLALLDNAVR